MASVDATDVDVAAFGDSRSRDATVVEELTSGTASQPHGNEQPNNGWDDNAGPRHPWGGRMSIAARRLAFLRAFREETWTMEQSSFSKPLCSFTGPTPSPNFPILRLLVKSSLFARF